MKSKVKLSTIRDAAQRIEGAILKTPLHRVPAEALAPLPHLQGKFVSIKMENLQYTGSFKLRGATNAVKSLDAQVNSVCAHSAGNHGAALAWASREKGLDCTIVCPLTAPEIKKKAMRELGAHVLEVEHSERTTAVNKLVQDTGATMIHPFDDDYTIAGQGTLGLEVFEQSHLPLDAVLVPMSGGGMAAGICAALSELSPRTRIVLVEPRGKNFAQALARHDRGSGAADALQPLSTIADGMRSRVLGERPWSLLKHLPPSAVLSVDDEAIVNAMTTLFSTFKSCVEPSGATALAALQSTDPASFEAAVGENAVNIAIIVCGGNLDIEHMLRTNYNVSPSK